MRQPFFIADNIDFSLAWRALWHGKVVSEIYVDRAELNFARQPVAAGPREAPDGEPPVSGDISERQREEWEDVVKDLFPISITHLEVRDSFVRYTDVTKEPHVDVFIKNMSGLATGLRNRPEETGQEFPASVLVEGDTIGQGVVKLTLAAEPLAEQPHFHVSLMVEDVHLRALNDSLRAIANVDVGQGTFNMAAEMAAADGAFEGYVKPFFENLDYTSLGDRKDGVFTRIWENIVAGLSWLLENKARDELATKIPFQGHFGDTDVGLLATIANLFRHGFVRAFNPTVEGTIDPARVPHNIGSGSEPDEIDSKARTDREAKL